MSIRILDKNTINQIAAGEVIDRPASIIKELVENSIDAGSTAVSIEIKGGGIDLIRISDNGCGIAGEDVRIAFVRHSTSKIKDAGDLAGVTSLGFRGEALASIAAVADVELITKTVDAFSATHFHILGGEELEFGEIGAPDGTTFIIRDIFKNVPVRRKFLKTANTEGSYCNEVVERIALSHPEVSFKYVNNGRTVIFTNGNGKLKDVIFGIYGRDIATETIEAEYPFKGGGDEGFNENGIQVKGCICKPLVARSNRNTENYFVNGRYIRHPAINKAIEDAYQPYMMQHKYPFTNLFISIDPAAMDVNVHPSKQEVRFENPQAVYNAVFEACRDALSGRALIHRMNPSEQGKKNAAPEKSGAKPEPFEVKRRAQISEENRIASGAINKKDNHLGLINEEPVKTVSVENKPEIKSLIKEEHVFNTETVNQPDKQQDNQSDNQPVNQPDKQQGKQPDKQQEPIKYEPVKKEIAEKEPAEKEPAEQRKISDDPSGLPSSVAEETVPYKYEQASLFEKEHVETKKEFKNIFENGYRIVGQVFNTYWIIECQGSMYMIDQHAAHEKIIYEKLMGRREEESVATQLLSPPIICSLSATEAEIVKNYGEELRKNGLVLEPFGGREYAISEVPLNDYGIDARQLLFELLDELAKPANGAAGREKGVKSAAVSIREKIATCSCKAAVKGNMELSEQEARELIKQLLEADNPFNCPHGRPVIIDMTKSEIEKRFKRII